MYLIVNESTREWHISSMETLGKNEIIINGFLVSDDIKENSHLYKINATNNGLILDTEKVNKKYILLRQKEYAKLNQDEMRFDDLINGTTTWVDSILAIKARFPKSD